LVAQDIKLDLWGWRGKGEVRAHRSKRGVKRPLAAIVGVKGKILYYFKLLQFKTKRAIDLPRPVRSSCVLNLATPTPVGG
jgi:hypothetical protein